MENYFQRFVENLENERSSASESTASEATELGTSPLKVSGQVAARLAVYDSLRAAPRVIDLGGADYRELIDILATKTYQSSKEIGGNMPYTVLREIIENLIHAYFKEVVISVFDGGNTVRISDQGPGIKNKTKAFEPGFSTATSNMKQFIKGVGSGLPITKETLSFLGGAITIEDNLNQGTVITLKVPGNSDLQAPGEISKDTTAAQPLVLNKKQQQILFLIMDEGPVGPSRIAKELDMSIATAHRNLVHLEDKSLIYSDEQGKRALTSTGIEFLDRILNS